MTNAQQTANAAIALKTRSGVTLDVSPAAPADIDALRAFFRQVAPEDLRYRFLGTIAEVSDDQLAAMTDSAMTTTFLARNVAGEIVAVATLAPEPGTDNAEVALSVRADSKHHGVSWSLLEYLLTVAKARGFEMVSSLEAGANREAIKLEREMGFVVRLTSAAPVEMLASKTLSD
jgi:GNAT superfamily N-acetyltransferase